MARWAVRQEAGRVEALHERSVAALSAPSARRGVVVMEPSDTALVLGSSQPAGLADAQACKEAGVGVVRRRSGGGAVLVEPGAQLWVDLVLPAGDPLWEHDVGRAAWWVGEAWARALAGSGLAGVGVWKGPLVRRPWSEWACFAALGAGEVTVPGGASAEGAKVLGISQRRTRAGALFQCSCLLRWDPEALVGLLALPPGQRGRAASDLRRLAAPVRGVAGAALLERFLAALP